MPFALLLFGIVLLVAAIRGKKQTHDLLDLLKDDFTGDNNFFVWVLAVIILVALGNIERIRPVTDAFLVLLILVMVLATGKRGLFDKLLSEIKAGTS